MSDIWPLPPRVTITLSQQGFDNDSIHCYVEVYIWYKEIYQWDKSFREIVYLTFDI
jgi:hypothetical protein